LFVIAASQSFIQFINSPTGEKLELGPEIFDRLN